MPIAEVDGEQAAAFVVDSRGHQGMRTDASARTPHLGAVEAHAITFAVCKQDRIAGLGGPNPPQLIGFGIWTV